jgi:hypothetical protein
MNKDVELTAYCGLYCADCLPSNQSLFRVAKKLKEELDKRQFENHAEIRSVYNEVFKDYEVFKKVLSEIIKLRCAAPCAKGGPFIKGGVIPDCRIRVCVHEKGVKGCWECSNFESCKLLEPLSVYHGDTPRYNLRLIKEYGIENWADKRGKHYLWDK